jgi:hypothetical protein
MRGGHAAHRIHHRPDDPNVVRYNLASWSMFFLSGGIVLMGAIFLAFGTVFLRQIAREAQ